MDRPEITADDVNAAITHLQRVMAKALNKQGTGGFISRHEILGALTEEFKEVVDAVHCKSLDKVAVELFDVAVVCVFGAACIIEGKIEDGNRK